MQWTPIFDTSSLINLSREDDLNSVVKRLTPVIPARGCPLSFVTVLELFRGLCNGDPAKATDTIKPLLLAARISRRVVLRAPLTFATWELFQVEEVLRHKPRLLMDWLKKIQQPSFPEKFASGEVTMNFEGLKRIFVKIGREEPRYTALFLDKWNPDWRKERLNGSALPESTRELVKRGMRLDTLRDAMPEQFLTQLQIECTPSNIEKTRVHCDAYFTFQVNRLRDSIIGNYRFEGKPNDFHDWMQLLYLTRPRFCFVTEDGPTLARTRQSGQRARIMSLSEFLSSAA